MISVKMYNEVWLHFFKSLRSFFSPFSNKSVLHMKGEQNVFTIFKLEKYQCKKSGNLEKKKITISQNR